jgi:hypothetical protein
MISGTNIVIRLINLSINLRYQKKKKDQNIFCKNHMKKMVSAFEWLVFRAWAS